MEAEELTLRPVRPADRARVVEMTADVWDGHDYLPSVFDDWVADPSAQFLAAEEMGQLVGLQRVRPIGPGLMYYEGLRVASTHRRRGLARRMLRAALEAAREGGFQRMRLVTGDNPPSQGLFESEGFRLLGRSAAWRASRQEGGDPPRIPPAAEIARQAAALGGLAGFEAYGGLNHDWQRPLELDQAELERLAAEGRLRSGAGGRALAVVQAESLRDLNVTLAVGSGGVFQDLMLALRFEADSQDRPGVWLLAPEEHPAAGDLRAVGYDVERDDSGRAAFHFHVYELRLAT